VLIFEGLIDSRTVKTNDDGAVHVDDWNAGLAGFFDCGAGVVNV
jgi:hypothetical protein